MAISTIRLQSLQSDSNLHNQTAISKIRQQSPQLSCNLHYNTAMQEDCSLIAEIAVWLLRWLFDCWDCSLILEVSQNRRTWNRGFPLVESPKLRPLIGWEDRIWKIQDISLSFRNLSFHSFQMAISTIRLQSSQTDSNLHNQTSISKIWQQSLQSDCNLHNRTAISTIRLQCRRIAVWLLRLHSDCGDCTRIAEIAIWLLILHTDCWDCRYSATYIYGWSSHRVSGRLRENCLKAMGLEW